MGIDECCLKGRAFIGVGMEGIGGCHIKGRALIGGVMGVLMSFVKRAGL